MRVYLRIENGAPISSIWTKSVDESLETIAS